MSGEYMSKPGSGGLASLFDSISNLESDLRAKRNLVERLRNRSGELQKERDEGESRLASLASELERIQREQQALGALASRSALAVPRLMQEARNLSDQRTVKQRELERIKAERAQFEEKKRAQFAAWDRQLTDAERDCVLPNLGLPRQGEPSDSVPQPRALRFPTASVTPSEGGAAGRSETPVTDLKQGMGPGEESYEYRSSDNVFSDLDADWQAE